MLVITLPGGSASPGAPAASPEWPQWRGPNRDALSTETGLLKSWGEAGPPLAWKAAGLGTGFSSLSISGGKIFSMGDRGGSQYVIGMNLADGKILWSTKVGPPHDDEYGGPRGTPTVDGDLLYAIGTEGDLVCLETATGRERWRKSLSGEFGGRTPGWKFAESPLVDGNKLVFTPGSREAGMVAVDKKTGKEIWRAAFENLGLKGLDEAPYASIVISQAAGVRQYVQLTARGLVGVRASDGKFLWGYNRIANRTATIPTPIVKGDYVFTSSGYNTGAALLKLTAAGSGPDATVNATEVYFLEPRTFQNHHGGMVLVGDHIYAGHGHNNGLPICIEFMTGKVVWGGDTRTPGATGSAAVLYADGHLYFRYQNGVMALLEATPAGLKQTGTFPIPGAGTPPSWSHPVIFGGKLYLREQDNLFAYNIK